VDHGVLQYCLYIVAVVRAQNPVENVNQNSEYIIVVRISFSAHCVFNSAALRKVNEYINSGFGVVETWPGITRARKRRRQLVIQRT
jgi:hypothetical protein